mmetsp:Transcript_62989/g.142151  ORF Transcript_62989/g.142151 Transcript_62989/m.142151 type:complete len:221 (+) Transcript_62989:61-723(+)
MHFSHARILSGYRALCLLTLISTIELACGRVSWTQAPGLALRAYNKALVRNPVTSNLFTGAVVTGASDAVCQKYVEGGDCDAVRVSHASLVGGLWSGMASPQIYIFMENSVNVLGLAKKRSVMLKALGATLFLSTVGNYINMSARRLLGGGYRDPPKVFEAVNAQIKEVVIADWKCWPLYDTLCFAVIPPHLRGCTTVCMSCAWGIYLSYMSNKGLMGAH